jgi:hypothetical protein
MAFQKKENAVIPRYPSTTPLVGGFQTSWLPLVTSIPYELFQNRNFTGNIHYGACIKKNVQEEKVQKFNS